jgi:hypothetical protein
MPQCVMSLCNFKVFESTQSASSPSFRGIACRTSLEALSMGLLAVLVVVPMILGHRHYQALKHLDVAGIACPDLDAVGRPDLGLPLALVHNCSFLLHVVTYLNT